ncbi:MAG TPA: hydroxyacid dehydrogenase [Propionibacteriaceae bacterium]|nr:hydroxyacid dehydrogenase [Propionibacteriaceae bacterium]
MSERSTSTRPKAVAVMRRHFFDEHFDTSRLARLNDLVELVGPVLEDVDSPEAREQLADVEVIISGWGMPALTTERLAAMPKLRGVFHCAGSVRGHVTDEVWDRDITITSAASANAVPVVEYTVAMIVLALKKALFVPMDRIEHGGWGDLSGYERTVGLVGLSMIGRGVAAALPKLLPTTTILAYDPFATPENTAGLGVELVSLDELCRRSDVLSIHAPNLPSTRHMIAAEQLALMPDHATLLNTARGALLDHDALAAECATGRIDAILDVTDPEPLPADHPLQSLPNVLLTPHIAGSRGTELHRMTDLALRDLTAWLDGRTQDMVGRIDRDTFERSA